MHAPTGRAMPRAMDRTFGLLATLLGFSGVAFGALGAHGVKKLLLDAPDAAARLGWWETGARYHLPHAIAIGLVAVLVANAPSRLSRAAGWLLTAGVLAFSGSLYVLTLTGVTPATRPLVFVTPLGGFLLLFGWASAAAALWRRPPAA